MIPPYSLHVVVSSFGKQFPKNLFLYARRLGGNLFGTSVVQ